MVRQMTNYKLHFIWFVLGTWVQIPKDPEFKLQEKKNCSGLHGYMDTKCFKSKRGPMKLLCVHMYMHGYKLQNWLNQSKGVKRLLWVHGYKLTQGRSPNFEAWSKLWWVLSTRVQNALSPKEEQKNYCVYMSTWVQTLTFVSIQSTGTTELFRVRGYRLAQDRSPNFEAW